MNKLKYPHLFSPITLAGTVFRNRIFGAPTGSTQLSSQHFPIPLSNAYYELKASGGAASVCVGDAVVDFRHGRFNDGHIALDNPASFRSLNNLSDAITRHGAVASIELSHAGSHARVSALAGETIYGPMASAGSDGPGVEALTDEKIREIIGQYAQAALLAKRCGFGMVTIHGGHGWLITEFMSPLTNFRKDKWGGSVENRCRFAVEICKAIRQAVGPRFPVEMRISGSECHPGGYDIDEGVAIAKQLDGHLDLIHVSAGSHEVWDVFTVTHPDMFLPEGVNVKYAAEIKKHVKTPVAAVGALSDPAMMEEIIASGKADVIQLARALFADPDLPNKARAGKENEINKCLRCFACFASLMNRGLFLCAINPAVGREVDEKSQPLPAVRKKVLVVGGGVGGMQAAITAARRGHDVTLCEKSDKMGGVLNCERRVPFKMPLAGYLERQAAETYRAGVQVLLNTEVTEGFASAFAPDVIIASPGSRPIVPDIPGVDRANAFSAESVYAEPEKAGGKVVIIGGGLAGAELAIYLHQLGREVCIVEMADHLNDGGSTLHGHAVDLELKRRGIPVHLTVKAIEITGEGLIGADGGERFFPADTVVYAAGQEPRWEAVEALRPLAPEFYHIGDGQPQNITETNKLAHYIARDIGRI